jgi:hypothetical protein
LQQRVNILPKRNQFSFRFSYQYWSRKQNVIAAKGKHFTKKISFSLISVLVFRTKLKSKVSLQQRVNNLLKEITTVSVSRNTVKNKVSLQPFHFTERNWTSV